MNPIGIMQGRLSAPGPRPQAFPRGAWQEEFTQARACGFERIEWLLDASALDDNPLFSDAGAREIRHEVDRTGVGVTSVCADYFISRPLTRDHWQSNATALGRVVQHAATAGIELIVVPILETAAIHDAADRERLLVALRGPLAQAELAGVRIALESDLDGDGLRALIGAAGSTALGACYDVGNATAAGHDLARDLGALAPCLFGVHIKDRVRGGRSLALGAGDVDFDALAASLSGARYCGALILETPVGGDALESARANLSYLRSRLGSPVAFS